MFPPWRYTWPGVRRELVTGLQRPVPGIFAGGAAERVWLA